MAVEETPPAGASSEDLYLRAHRLHYDGRDPNSALPLYRAIIEQFPESVEAAYSRDQIENIEPQPQVDPQPDHKCPFCGDNMIRGHIWVSGGVESHAGASLDWQQGSKLKNGLFGDMTADETLLSGARTKRALRLLFLWVASDRFQVTKLSGARQRKSRWQFREVRPGFP